MIERHPSTFFSSNFQYPVVARCIYRCMDMINSKQRKRMNRFIFASVAILVATGATAEPLADSIGSKAYWQALVWDKAEQSKVWTMSGWNSFKGKQEPGQVFTMERLVEIDGKNLHAYLIVVETPGRQNLLSINSIELSNDECEQIGSWLSQRFGQPRIVVDGTYKFDLVAPGNWVEIVDKVSQWNIGSTRATFRCGGLKTATAEKLGEKNKLITLLTFGSKASERELKPLFGLRCTRRIEFIAIAKAPENLDDLVLVIDENQKRVRSANKVPFPGEHRITEDAIEFQIKKDDLTVEYFIDRHTGALKSKLRYLKGGGADISGRCEKSEPSERKF
jgi:hypothetical protein